jgi:hypothetical protein
MAEATLKYNENNANQVINIVIVVGNCLLLFRRDSGSKRMRTALWTFLIPP